MNNATRFPFLLRAPLLEDLPEADARAFLDRCKVQQFEQDTPLLRQGEPADGMYMIAHGSVEVGFVSSDGDKSILYHAGQGHVVGLIEAVADRTCAAGCQVLANGTVLFCPTAQLLKALTMPMLLRNSARLAHDALLRDNWLRSVDQFQSVEQRIGLYLLHLASQNATFTQSQAYLANAVGCSRQTVNKELGRLRELEIIDKARGAITVLDPAALRKRVNMLGQSADAG